MPKYLDTYVPKNNTIATDGLLSTVRDVNVPENLIRRAKKYYDAEGSHGWNHIQDVLGRANLMVNPDNRQLSDPEIAAVLFHDSSLRGGDRKTHHIDSSKIAEKELAALFDQRTLKRISKAIQQHRGSYKGKYYSKLSELVSSADRGAPNLEDIIKRSYLYQTEHGYADPEKLVVEHIKSKYGRDGYARKPFYYQRLYADKLNKMYDDIDNLTTSEVLRVVGK
jgi:HD superfamily phosphodiesterase